MVAQQSKKMSTVEANLIEMEYRELNNNIRECWKYISDLLRNVIFIQLLLISLVLLGGQFVKVQKIDIQPTSQEDVETRQNESDATSFNKESNDTNKNIAFSILVVLGGFSAVGAAIQNYRLFGNASTFVRRAAFLETYCKLVKDDRNAELGAAIPPNAYMSKKLYSEGGRNFLTSLETWMRLMYLIFACAWGLVALISFELV